MSLHMSAHRRKTTAVAGALILGMAALVGCADTSGTSGSTTSASAETATTGNIVWWGYTPGSPVNEQYVAAFNKAYPDIKVTWKQTGIDDYDAALRPALGNASGLDVYQMSAGSANGGVSVFGGSAIDLTPAVQQELGADWKGKLSSTGVDALTVDGQLKGLAAGAVFSGTVWINKDLFDSTNSLRRPIGRPGSRPAPRSRPTASPASSREPARALSTSTRSTRSLTTSHRALL